MFKKNQKEFRDDVTSEIQYNIDVKHKGANTVNTY